MALENSAQRKKYRRRAGAVGGVEALLDQDGVDGEEPRHLFGRVGFLPLGARAAEHGLLAIVRCLVLVASRPVAGAAE